jgi:hypothetical protein
VHVLQRVLLIVLVLYALWRIVTAWGRRLRRDGPGAESYSRFNPSERRKRSGAPSGESLAPEELVACSHCGTYVPARRTLTEGGGTVFCGDECRRAHDVPAAHDDRSN